MQGLGELGRRRRQRCSPITINSIECQLIDALLEAVESRVDVILLREEGRAGLEERGDLFLREGLRGRAHDGILRDICAAVESAQGGWVRRAGLIWVCVTHEGYPDLDGAFALEDVDPYGAAAPANELKSAQLGEREDVLEERRRVLSEKFVKEILVRARVKFHTPLLHNLTIVVSRRFNQIKLV